MKANQRFVAGAVCPDCQQIDSLVLNLDDQSIYCVDCGFTQTEAQRDQLQREQKPQAKSTNSNHRLADKVKPENLIIIQPIKD